MKHILGGTDKCGIQQKFNKEKSRTDKSWEKAIDGDKFGGTDYTCNQLTFLTELTFSIS